MLDDTDTRLLRALAADARQPLKTLAHACGLSGPATAERLRKLHDKGVVTGATVTVNAAALGYPLQALVRVRTLPGQTQAAERVLRALPQVVECDKITGEDCYLARLVLRSAAELDPLLARLAPYAETHTAIVKAKPVPLRLPPLPADGA